jgi:hypothetical protein
MGLSVWLVVRNIRRGLRSPRLAVPKKGGPPPLEPTEQERATVRLLAGYDYSYKRICMMVVRNGQPISVDTLQRHFAIELQTSRAEVDEEVLIELRRAVRRLACDPVYLEHKKLAS